jgi:hypothetical protein
MKVEGWLFLGCGIFFGAADIVYWYLSKDPTGTTALALAVGLALLTGFYVLFTGRRLAKRPEDDNQGEVEQGTGEIGFFSPLVAAVPSARRRLRGAGPGRRLVALPDRALLHRARLDRLRLRVLPGPLLPLRSARRA